MLTRLALALAMLAATTSTATAQIPSSSSPSPTPVVRTEPASKDELAGIASRGKLLAEFDRVA